MNEVRPKLRDFVSRADYSRYTQAVREWLKASGRCSELWPSG